MSNKYHKSLTFRNAAAGNRAAASYRKQFDLGINGEPRQRRKVRPAPTAQTQKPE